MATTATTRQVPPCTECGGEGYHLEQRLEYVPSGMGGPGVAEEREIPCPDCLGSGVERCTACGDCPAEQWDGEFVCGDCLAAHAEVPSYDD